MPATGEESAAHPFGQVHAAALDATPIGEACPLVVFSHGNSGLRRQSTFLTTHLASWGIAVVAPDHSGNTFPEMARISDEDERIAAHLASRARRPHDALAAIDAALGGALGTARLDATRIAALGHSFGGWTATKLPRLDERIAAVCLLAPASEPFVGRRAYEPGELPFARPTPTLVMPGIADVLVDLATSVLPLAERLAGPKAVVGVEGADHFHFCDGIERLHGVHFATTRKNQTRPTKPYDRSLSEARCHRAVRGLATWFLARAFAGDEHAVTRLDANALAALEHSLLPL